MSSSLSFTTIAFCTRFVDVLCVNHDCLLWQPRDHLSARLMSFKLSRCMPFDTKEGAWVISIESTEAVSVMNVSRHSMINGWSICVSLLAIWLFSSDNEALSITSWLCLLLANWHLITTLAAQFVLETRLHNYPLILFVLSRLRV